MGIKSTLKSFGKGVLQTATDFGQPRLEQADHDHINEIRVVVLEEQRKK